MKKKYKTVLNEVFVKRDVVGEKVNVGYKLFGSFENGVGNEAHRACSLKREKSSFPAMRNITVRMVSKRAYPRALRLAA